MKTVTIITDASKFDMTVTLFQFPVSGTPTQWTEKTNWIDVSHTTFDMVASCEYVNDGRAFSLSFNVDSVYDTLREAVVGLVADVKVSRAANSIVDDDGNVLVIAIP